MAASKMVLYSIGFLRRINGQFTLISSVYAPFRIQQVCLCVIQQISNEQHKAIISSSSNIIKRLKNDNSIVKHFAMMTKIYT